jgi:hypothetical protein
MTKSDKDIEVSDRLRSLLEANLGHRGKFGMLEKMSGITEARWKNFWYRKQSATADMIDFACKKYPDEEVWLRTGQRAPRPSDFPFAAPIYKKRNGETIGDRLNWVIKEWAAPRGEQLFSYLEERSKGAISAKQWADVVLGLHEPTSQMIAVVCDARPLFTEWVVLGHAGTQQVDPTDDKSVEAWKATQQRSWDAITQSIAKDRLTND